MMVRSHLKCWESVRLPSVELADSIINALDLYARMIDRGSYGLPVFDNNEMNQMRSLIVELLPFKQSASAT